MQHLAIKRKVVDPKIDRVGGAANFELDRIAFTKLRNTVVEAQAKAALSQMTREAQDIELGKGSAERSRDNIDIDLRLTAGKKMGDELNQLRFLVGIRHCSRNHRRTAAGNAIAERCAIYLPQRALQLVK